MPTTRLPHLPATLPATFAAVCALLLQVPAAAGAQDAAALAFLQSVYTPYQTSSEPPDNISAAKAPRYFTPPLVKLIARDAAASKKCGCVVNLDFDPFVNTQDWAKTAIDLKVSPGATADRATGVARYVFPGEKQETVITLDLQKTAAGWRISDFHWSNTPESFVQILSHKP
jgi:Protein of unknown function (DUF3828)